VKVDTAVRGTAVLVEGGDKNGAIREGDRNTEVVRKGASDENAPRELKAPEPSAESDQQRFESQIEQERGKGVPLTDPTSHRNRTNRVIIVHENSGGVGVCDRKGVLKEGRKAELGENRGKVRMGNPVVGFFLVEKDQHTVHRAVLKILFGGIT